MHKRHWKRGGNARDKQVIAKERAVLSAAHSALFLDICFSSDSACSCSNSICFMDIRNPLSFTLSTLGEWHVHLQRFNLFLLEIHEECGMSSCRGLDLSG